MVLYLVATIKDVHSLLIFQEVIDTFFWLHRYIGDTCLHAMKNIPCFHFFQLDTFHNCVLVSAKLLIKELVVTLFDKEFSISGLH